MRLHPAACLLPIIIFAAALATAAAEEKGSAKPFPGAYQLNGNPNQLLAGDKIVLEEYVTPLCSHCYIFFRELKKPLGADVEVRHNYVFLSDKGQEPVRLLMLARLAKPEVENELLVGLFDASFVQKVSIENEDVLSAIADKYGLGAQWKDAGWRAKVDAAMAKLSRKYEKMGGPPKTPLLVINDTIALSPGISGVQGDGLPQVLDDVLNQVRAYRQAHKK